MNTERKDATGIRMRVEVMGKKAGLQQLNATQHVVSLRCKHGPLIHQNWSEKFGNIHDVFPLKICSFWYTRVSLFTPIVSEVLEKWYADGQKDRHCHYEAWLTLLTNYNIHTTHAMDWTRQHIYLSSIHTYILTYILTYIHTTRCYITAKEW